MSLQDIADEEDANEENNAVDYQAVAVARIRDVVDEINTEFLYCIDSLTVSAHSSGNIVMVNVDYDDEDERLADIDTAKTDIIQRRHEVER